MYLANEGLLFLHWIYIVPKRLWTSDRLWHLQDAVKQIQAASSSVSLLCHGLRSTCLNPSRNGTSIQANGLYSRGAVRQLWLWGLNEMIILDSKWWDSFHNVCVAQISCVLLFFIQYIFRLFANVYGRQLFLACNMRKAWNPTECTNKNRSDKQMHRQCHWRVWGNLPVIHSKNEVAVSFYLCIRMEKPQFVNFLWRVRGLQECIHKNHRQDETMLNKGVSLRLI